jgi:signal transduction histidine kinase
MVNFILENVCSFLVAMNLIFIVIELRSKFDRSFLIFGISNMLISVSCAIDIWLQPEYQTINCTRIQHVIAVFFPATITWYLGVIIHKEIETQVKLLLFAGVLFTPFFFTDIMLRPDGKEAVSTIIYNVTFIPFIFLWIFYITSLLITNIPKTDKKERKVLIYHLVGLFTICIGGILDVFTVATGHHLVHTAASFSTFGLMFFCVVVTLIFTDRLTGIIRDREVTFGKLQSAYKEMEEVQALKELGQSTAIINHEIKNYTFVISGYAQYLFDRAQLSDKHKKIVSTIAETAAKMAAFSNEILNFSKARILNDKRPLDIVSLIENCIRTHFYAKKDLIKIINHDPSVTIYGDWSRLEHVFVNIIKNSFEAYSESINFKLLKRDAVLLLVVEDDGDGCNEEQLANMFKSFYTTKKNRGGTGLGMCVIKSIIESHGGYISAYSKNILNNGLHGLVINMALPLFSSKEDILSSTRDHVVLIKDGVTNFAQVIRIFQNVLISPYIVQGVDDLDSKKIPLEKSAIYASVRSLDLLKKKVPASASTHALVEGSTNMVFVVNENKNRSLYAFSENYILENINN